VFDAVLPLLNDFARVPVCGLIAQYNTGPDAPDGPDRVPALMRRILVSHLRVQGFIVYDYASDEARFRADMAAWIQSGQVRYKEDIVDGLDAAPEALIGMLEGQNFGKLIVHVSD
jgi:NADPH-dependent curcumin reductase CurA